MTSVTGLGGRTVGVLGGTFDPPHIGHLRAAVAVRHALALDRVLLVPNGDPWQKRGVRPITPAPLRLEMVRAAQAVLASGSGVEVSDREVRRDGPSFTIDTVVALQEADPDLEVTLILGRDAAALLPTWERHDDLLRRAHLAVVDRPGSAPGPPLHLEGARLQEVAIEQLDVSSSAIRDLVDQGDPIDVLVAPGVAAVIDREGLYRA
ncbi:MAG: nicotinate-nucleotide adenylyltransferase [Iamia sp.]